VADWLCEASQGDLFQVRAKTCGADCFSRIKDNLIFFKNLNLYQIEDGLNILANGRQPP
jgi:hypothetical protein